MIVEQIGEPPTLANGSRVPLSPAIRTGDFLFVSGQLGLGDDGQVVSENVAEQTQQALTRIQSILQQGGSDLEKIVKANIWLTNAEDFPAVNGVWTEVFGERPPARSTVLSGLLIPGASIEIDAIALVG